jgi:chemotaxis protein MotA
MNFSAIFGLALSAAVVWFGVVGSQANLKVFLVPNILFVILGGTFAAALIVFPMGRLVGLFRFLLFGVIFKSRTQNFTVATETVRLYHNYMMSREKIVIDNKFHPFLVEGVGIIKKSTMSDADLQEILESRVAYLQHQYSLDTQMLRAIAKFPPAFGFIAAVATLLTQLSNVSGGLPSLEQGMTPLLVSCLWGWLLPAVVLLPLADHSEKICDDEIQTRSMIVHAVLVMNRLQSVTYLTETLSGYLSVKDRKKIKEFATKIIAQSNLHRVADKPTRESA